MYQDYNKLNRSDDISQCYVKVISTKQRQTTPAVFHSAVLPMIDPDTWQRDVLSVQTYKQNQKKQKDSTLKCFEYNMGFCIYSFEDYHTKQVFKNVFIILPNYVMFMISKHKWFDFVSFCNY